MKIEIRLTAAIIIVVAFLTGCAFNRSKISDPQKNSRLKVSELHPIGIADPDGNKSVWLMSLSSYKAIQDMLQKYSVKEVEGLKFYTLTSWKDTCRILMAANEQQGLILYSMAHELKKMKRQVVGSVYKRNERPTSISDLEERVRRLERSKNGGYR
jgi:hypothetical protein